MIDWIVQWASFRKNVNFWDWVRDSFSEAELRKIADEVTNVDLIRPYDPFGNSASELRDIADRKTIRRLLRRYGTEIWSCCLGAGGYDPDKGLLGIRCLSNLDLARQVHDTPTFEEFLVRNALKCASIQILVELDKANGDNHG